MNKIPKYLERRIRELEEHVARAELTTPWNEPGRDWYTLFKGG
jgi:hypothetical protein